jgi:hypothetical protein
MVDLDVIESLIHGKREPENLGEEMFIKMYKSAMAGELLFSILMDLNDLIDELGEDEWNMLVIGYAVGQHDLETVEYELSDDKTRKLH